MNRRAFTKNLGLAALCAPLVALFTKRTEAAPVSEQYATILAGPTQEQIRNTRHIPDIPGDDDFYHMGNKYTMVWENCYCHKVVLNDDVANAYVSSDKIIAFWAEGQRMGVVTDFMGGSLAELSGSGYHWPKGWYPNMRKSL